MDIYHCLPIYIQLFMIDLFIEIHVFMLLCIHHVDWI